MGSLRLSEFTLAGLFLAVAVVAAQPTQLVRLDLVLPDGATPSLKVASGERAQLVVGDQLNLGLIPRVSGDTVAVELYDASASPERLVDTLELEIGGSSVELADFPGLQVAVPRVEAL